MNRSIIVRLSAVIALFALAGLEFVSADPSMALPVTPSKSSPALLLELGSTLSEMSLPGVSILPGQVSKHEGASSLQSEADAVSVLHAGFAAWKVDFRFKLNADQPAAAYRFWARWRQGGDPNVCVQTFEIWAGPDAEHLALRQRFLITPKGWEYAWLAGAELVKLQADDRLIEIRNSGNGHDAKVFDAFLLASPWAALPIEASAEQPALLLELGKTPALAAAEKPAFMQVLPGTAVVGSGAQSLLTADDEVQIFHQGFGDWGANFRFELPASLQPGQYRLQARYKSGGEVSQVRQNFVVKAGAKPEELASRAEFALTNSTPWDYQWLAAASTVTLLPGDRWLTIENTGKADGAKVFDAFLLKLDKPLGDWMSGEQAQSRNRFLAQTNAKASGERRLYVLDGKGDGAEILFSGLATDAAKRHYARLPVTYLIGPEAEVMAQQLNLATLPVALITDDHYSVLGSLARPSSEADVIKFLAEASKFGTMPTPVAIVANVPKALKNGVPDAWLVGGLQDGLAGVSVFGLDNDSVLRPNPDQSYLSLEMMGGRMRAWRESRTQPDGTADIEASTGHAYGWSRGSGYAQLYLHTDQARLALLHLQQSGIKAAGWLDGQAFSFSDDPQPPAAFSKSVGESTKALLHGLTTEGLLATAKAERTASPQRAALNLTPGWHSLLLKLVMQHDQGQRFYFSGVFTDLAGTPSAGINSQLSDPNADLALNRVAAKLRPLMFVAAPANLPHVGDAVKVRLDLRWQPILEETALSTPLPRFPAKLRLRLVDYSGKQIAEREINDKFPAQVEADFGKLSQPGYYAVYPTLYTPDGRLIMQYPADGFTVVAGDAAQKQRLDKKKLWNNDYYALADGDKSFNQVGGYFNWLERMGIFRSLGSYPGFDAQYQPLWEQAKQRGLQLFADSSGDSNWLNDNPKDGQTFFEAAANYTRFSKATNEIDIRHEAQWQKLREPAHWLERAQWEYQLAHQQRQDAHYIGGSLVRPGETDWFKQVLQLGLDKYQDAWDVHAYPQQAPRFGAPIGNGANEDERGVLATYASLGRSNKLPFWLGETGAKAMHGLTGRRWQAEQVAKIIAWVNSRSDYLGVAFCIAHEYDLAYGRIWDYSLGHKPGEAAMYTASALIDGLPYQAFDAKDANIQGGYFGETLMLWRSDDSNSVWSLPLDLKKSWVLVDVVGQFKDLPVDSSGRASVPLSSSPVYLLPRAEYLKLTRD